MEQEEAAAGAARVVVVRTGTANLASVLAGLRRAGCAPTLTHDAAVVREAERVVLPGVGAFGAAMAQLAQQQLVEVLAERVRAGRPTLAVCVGLQLLCEASQESPGVRGLGVVPVVVQRFAGEQVRVPQLGWNEVEAAPGAACLRSGYAYFANSYCLKEAPPGWVAAYSDHGGRFVAAMERRAVLACQFHPELSGAFGIDLLRRWAAGGSEGVC